jgi:hypothetical protein
LSASWKDKEKIVIDTNEQASLWTQQNNIEVAETMRRYFGLLKPTITPLT